MTPEAERLNAEGLAHEEHGEHAKAEEAYRSAIAASGSWSVPWFNLGLLYKRQRKWADSFRCNVRATELNPQDEGAWWNLGIAATALGKWQDARRAWRHVGISVPEGEGPLNLQLGLVPIRINPDEHAEVVWCERLDPARGIIQNIPLPESGHRHLDLILHDGEPKGSRVVNGRDVPVFDELQLLAASDMRTFEAIISAQVETDVERLIELAGSRGLAAEDWSSDIRHLCKRCSEGKPTAHQQGPGERSGLALHVGFAGRTKEDITQLLKDWAVQSSGCEWSSLQQLL